MKISYFGLDLGKAVLETLIRHGHEIVSVHFASDEVHDSQLAHIAEAHGIPSSPERPTVALLHQLADQKTDLLLVNGYPHRIPIGDSAPKGVNVHPTLLPEGRGPWPFPWTILQQLQETGITTHKLTDVMDAGDVLLQTRYPVERNETLDSLIAKYQLAAPDHVLQLLENFHESWNRAKTQEGGSAWPDPTHEHSTLDWNQSIANLDRTIRAFGSDGCSAILNGHVIRIRSADCWMATPRHGPGTIVPEVYPSLAVAASDGYLLLRDYNYE